MACGLVLLFFMAASVVGQGPSGEEDLTKRVPCAVRWTTVMLDEAVLLGLDAWAS